MFQTFSFGHVNYLLQGAIWTLVLAGIALVCGGVLGAIVAQARISTFAPLRYLMQGYIYVVQGTPLLVLLFICYYGVSYLGIELPAIMAAAVGFTVYVSAFLGEIWRGCIQSVARGQWEGGAALALTRWQTLRYIVVPQAFRVAIPPTVGFLVQIIKETSLVSTIGIFELTLAGRFLSAATYRPLEAYSLVAVVYFLICFPLTHWSRALERKLNADR